MDGHIISVMFQDSICEAWCRRPLVTSAEVRQTSQCLSAMAKCSSFIIIHWMLGTWQRSNIHLCCSFISYSGWLWSSGYIQLVVLSRRTSRGLCTMFMLSCSQQHWHVSVNGLMLLTNWPSTNTHACIIHTDTLGFCFTCPSLWS